MLNPYRKEIKYGNFKILRGKDMHEGKSEGDFLPSEVNDKSKNKISKDQNEINKKRFFFFYMVLESCKNITFSFISSFRRSKESENFTLL